jgi:hypothetical protein
MAHLIGALNRDASDAFRFVLKPCGIGLHRLT